MTSAYQQQLAQQLRDAETELGQWRQQGHRADRYRTAWLSARERAQAYGEGILRLCSDRDQALTWLRTAEAERFEAGQLSHQYRTRAEQAEARIAAVRAACEELPTEVYGSAAACEHIIGLLGDGPREEDGMVLVATIPVQPEPTVGQQPVFTGVLAYLAEEDWRP